MVEGMNHPTPTAIDCHAHVIASDRPIHSHRHAQPVRSHLPSELLAEFDRCGVAYGLLTAPSFYLTDNSLLLETLEAYPRFKGTATLAPNTSLAELNTLKEKGICGARLNWYRSAISHDVSHYRDLFARLKEADLHLELFTEGQHLPLLLPTILASEVKLVLDHFGCPDPDGGINSPGFIAMLDSMQTGRTWVKLSAPYRIAVADNESAAKRYAQAMLACSGAERLLWGSDWPWTAHEFGMTYSLTREWLNDWIESEADRETILCKNPRDLFGFPARTDL